MEDAGRGLHTTEDEIYILTSNLMYVSSWDR